jgi:putative transposase
MTVRDMRAHLREMHQVEVSPDLISRVTYAVVDELAEWRSRALDAVWPVIFIDALMMKIRDGVVTNRAVYLAVGIDCDGNKQVLGLWIGPTTRRVRQVLAQRAQRPEEPRGGGRVRRVLRRADRVAGCDRRGLAAGDRAAVRRAPDPRLAAVRLEEVLGAAEEGSAPVYTAADEAAAAAALEDFAAAWGERYPAIVKVWRAHWAAFTPFLAFPPEVRRVIDTTNLIESMNSRLRKVTRNRGQFPSEQAALKVLYLAVRNLEDYRSPNTGIRSSGWKQSAAGVHDLLRRTNPDPMTATIIYTDGRTLPDDLPPLHEARSECSPRSVSPSTVRPGASGRPEAALRA